MSAWYIFSAMGFYPVAPGDLSYAIGAPQIPEVNLQLSGGKSFKTIAHGLSEKNKYIAKATLNGKPLKRSYITHADIVNGGVLEYQMSDTPNKTWAVALENRPPSMSKK